MGNGTGVRTAIHRLINYKETTMDSLKKVVDYACNKDASPSELQSFRFISGVDSAVSDIRFFENRFHKKPGRLFKHWIYVPGLRVDEIEADKLLAYGNEVLKECFSDYPNVIAIHMNKPRRIHLHAVIGCTSVINGKKLDQSPSGFDYFCSIVDGLAKEYHLPLLRKKRENIKLNELTKGGFPEAACNSVYYDSAYIPYPIGNPVLNTPVVSLDNTEKNVAEYENPCETLQILQQQVLLAQLALTNNIVGSINNAFLKGLEDAKNEK